MNSIETGLLKAAIPLACGVVAREIVQLGMWAKAKLSANPKLAALAPVVQALEDALTAAEQAFANSQSKGEQAAALAALQAALAVLKAEEGSLIDAADAEAKALLGVSGPDPVMTPGGTVVNMPKIGDKS